MHTNPLLGTCPSQAGTMPVGQFHNFTSTPAYQQQHEDFFAPATPPVPGAQGASVHARGGVHFGI